jgi:hypothetical protein
MQRDLPFARKDEPEAVMKKGERCAEVLFCSEAGVFIFNAREADKL